MGNYGFSALSSINPPPPNNNKGGGKGITYGRVFDIILDENHPKFDLNGEWGSIGVIFFKSVEFNQTPGSGTKGTKAFPYFPNFKHYPLIGEIVPILFLPSVEIGERSTSTVAYYLPPTNIWNTVHQNAQPVIVKKPNSLSKTIFQTLTGSPNITPTSQSEVELGETFKEKNDIHSLQPFEGDVIIEGRWGNSIRLGSTVIGKANNWSEVGDDGDPIIIIRNGQNKSNPNESWVPEAEDISDSPSSIYLTSTQKLPLDQVLSDYRSFSSSPPTSPQEYNKEQIIIDSGRIILNSSLDHILLSSNLAISFNSNEGFYFDTPSRFTVKAGDTIRLGDTEAPHPVLKGDITIDILSGLISEMIKFVSLFPSVPTPGLEGVKAGAGMLLPKLTQIKAELETKTKSSKTFTK